MGINTIKKLLFFTDSNWILASKKTCGLNIEVHIYLDQTEAVPGSRADIKVEMKTDMFTSPWFA